VSRDSRLPARLETVGQCGHPRLPSQFRWMERVRQPARPMVVALRSRQAPGEFHPRVSRPALNPTEIRQPNPDAAEPHPQTNVGVHAAEVLLSPKISPELPLAGLPLHREPAHLVRATLRSPLLLPPRCLFRRPPLAPRREERYPNRHDPTSHHNKVRTSLLYSRPRDEIKPGADAQNRQKPIPPPPEHRPDAWQGLFGRRLIPCDENFFLFLRRDQTS